MRYSALTTWNKTRLRAVLVLFFLALAVPTTILIVQASRQMKWEAFHQQRMLAEELVKRIDRRYLDLINNENARPFTDYTFLNVIADPKVNILQRSPLSVFPLETSIPGAIGYFQIDNAGRFSTPLLPESEAQGISSGLSSQELEKRQQTSMKIYHALIDNHLIGKINNALKKDVINIDPDKQKKQSTMADTVSSDNMVAGSRKTKPQKVESQAGFDMLQEQRLAPQPASKAYSSSFGRIEDLKLENNYQRKALERESKEDQVKRETSREKRALRKERNILPVQQPAVSLSVDKPVQRNDVRVNIFESEIDAFEFSMLESGHFVLFRKVWRDGQRYIQGLLIEAAPFIAGVIGSTFQETVVSYTSNLAVAYRGNVLSVLSARDSDRYLSDSDALQETLLLHERLSPALDQLELIFSVNRLPAGPGGVIVTWLSLIIFLVLFGGFLLIYRLALKQLNLARQQQDFVSAVSHELKTPLTSIRMYGEMLREGWVNEEKRKTYYEYIYDESERLTRLINNVLQLARMTRNDVSLEIKSCTVAQLLDIIKSKVVSLADRNGFAINIIYDNQATQEITEVDMDHFTQIFINLVDNAIKFAANAEKKKIDIGCNLLRNKQLQFYVRDYGPGIAKDQMRKIFSLFYRSGNELTRDTVGTGIGLALVKQLAQAMHGSVNVVNRDPGAEFMLLLKAK